MTEDKFNTCKFRSDQEIVLGNDCCGGEPLSGFVCFRLNIEFLLPKTCEACDFYHRKLIEETEKQTNTNT